MAPPRARASEARHGRAPAIVALAAMVSLVVGVLSQTQTFRLFDLRLFDTLSTLAPPSRPADSPIIVAIDEPSFAEIGRQWPWPRDLHADLVTALRAAGARAIGLDMIFAEPSAPEADAALAAAMGPDVVLAADETRIETAHADQFVRVMPLIELTDAGARPGLVSVLLEGDGLLRRIPPYPDSFARRLADTAGGTVETPPAGALLQVFGPARTYETVSYYQALDPAAFLPEGTFRDRIVIVGLSMQSAPSVDKGGADAFATSWTPRSGRLVAGAEVQATILDNLTGRLWIESVPGWILAGIAVAAAIAAALAVLRGTGWATVAIAAAAVAVIVAASLLLLVGARIYVPPTAPALAFVLVAGVQSARDYAAERRQRRAIIRAFSQYLSPVLVQRLASDPDQLRLGGERRLLTILFCDVRGFTTISERMKDDPEGLTRLVHRLLNPLSETILAHGGTIDKYIGDAIMAFWNAPIEDANHATHAVEAGRAMLEAVAALNLELERDRTAASGVRFAIGIGINTGECVVGNVGSDFRFNYSALGDPVNLAARLESETKSFGVPILIGEETAIRVGKGIRLAGLGRIRVKGKTEAVAVHTPVARADPQALAGHEALIADLEAGVLAHDDPRFATLGAALPELAPFHAVLAQRLKTASA
jgi:adenylate cyclase